MFNDDMPFIGREENNGGRVQSASSPEANITGRPRICVIGVGGAGNNAVNNMISAGITSAEFIAVNTDAQILACNKAPVRIQIGTQRTKGLGAGAEPEVGRDAAEESKEEIARAIDGVDLLFITAGMGGGTGTGAAPVIAKIAKENKNKKILTVAVVTKPFEFEGRRRMDNAEKGIANLRKYVDTIIIIPNERITDVIEKNASMTDALRVADEVLKQGIRGIADLIVTPSLINLDFADVRTVLKDKGLAHMGVGASKGENRIVEAVRGAVNCPLLDTTIEGAMGVIINVVGGNDLTFDEVRTAASLIHSVVDYSANIIVGACVDPNIHNEVQVTVIATGFPYKSDPLEEPVEEPVSFNPFQRPQAAQPVYTQAPQPSQPIPQPENVPERRMPEPNGTEQEYYTAPRNPYEASQPEPPHETIVQEVVEDEPEVDTSSGSRLPPFVQRLLGKKK